VSAGRERILNQAIDRGLTRADAAYTTKEIISFFFATGFAVALK